MKNQDQVIWKRMIYKGEDLGDFFEISNIGEIRYTKTKILLKQHIGGKGYMYTWLYLSKYIKGRKDKHIRVHIPVAETFIPNPECKNQVNHKNGDKCNNKASNLEWNTQSENMKHATTNNLINFNKKQIRCIETNKIYKSVTEASEDLAEIYKKENPDKIDETFNLKKETDKRRKNISRALQKSNFAYGFHWEYVS